MDQDCFFNYEDAKEKYDKLYDNSTVENLKLTKVIEEKETGVVPQEYYAWKKYYLTQLTWPRNW